MLTPQSFSFASPTPSLFPQHESDSKDTSMRLDSEYQDHLFAGPIGDDLEEEDDDEVEDDEDDLDEEEDEDEYEDDEDDEDEDDEDGVIIEDDEEEEDEEDEDEEDEEENEDNEDDDSDTLRMWQPVSIRPLSRRSPAAPR